jgi:Fe-S oxidoreductase
MKKIELSSLWIQKLNSEADKCIECKLCMKNCPMLSTFSSTPKELLKGIGAEGKINDQIPFSCCLCGYCTQVCPKDIDLKEVFYGLRRYITKENGEVPRVKGYNTVKFHQKNSFSRLFTASHKPESQQGIKRAFLPGCSLTSHSPYMVKKIYEYLRTKLPNTGIILKCCGKPTESMGEDNKFKKYYNELQREIDKMNVSEIIVACQNCYKTINQHSKNVRVRSLWEVMAELGVPEEKKGIGKNVDVQFAIHDPCPTRKEAEIHKSVRNILKELGFSTIEFENCKENTSCCGRGGMVGVTNNKLATEQMKKRAEQTEASHILSYCQSCVEAMIIGGKKSVHILDLVFNDDMYESNNFTQSQKGAMKQWFNRYEGKRMIDSLKRRD